MEISITNNNVTNEEVVNANEINAGDNAGVVAVETNNRIKDAIDVTKEFIGNNLTNEEIEEIYMMKYSDVNGIARGIITVDDNQYFIDPAVGANVYKGFKDMIKCPLCHESITYVRESEKRIEHFRHRPGSNIDCPLHRTAIDDLLIEKTHKFTSNAESWEHKKLKEKLVDLINSEGLEVTINNIKYNLVRAEKELKVLSKDSVTNGYRPDVVAYTDDGMMVCIEVTFYSGKRESEYRNIWMRLNVNVIEVIVKDNWALLKGTSKKVKYEVIHYKNAHLDLLKDLKNIKGDNVDLDVAVEDMINYIDNPKSLLKSYSDTAREIREDYKDKLELANNTILDLNNVMDRKDEIIKKKDEDIVGLNNKIDELKKKITRLEDELKQIKQDGYIIDNMSEEDMFMNMFINSHDYDYENMTTKEIISEQLKSNNLTYINSEYDDDIYVVTRLVTTKYATIYIDLHQISTAKKIINIKVDKKYFQEKPLSKGDIIKVVEIVDRNKFKPCGNGWIQTDEVETVLTKYGMVVFN